jgi:hypothetical protein
MFLTLKVILSGVSNSASLVIFALLLGNLLEALTCFGSLGVGSCEVEDSEVDICEVYMELW